MSPFFRSKSPVSNLGKILKMHGRGLLAAQ
jgi:hypothetical protein